MNELFNGNEVYERYRITNNTSENIPLPSTGHLVKAGTSIVVMPHVITEHMMILIGRPGVSITGVTKDEYNQIQSVSADRKPVDSGVGVQGNSAKKAEKSGS